MLFTNQPSLYEHGNDSLFHPAAEKDFSIAIFGSFFAPPTDFLLA